MASAPGKRIYAGRWIRPERLGGSPEWTAGLRRHPSALWVAGGLLTLCALLPVVAFPALYVAAAACGAFYLDNEPLEPAAPPGTECRPAPRPQGPHRLAELPSLLTLPFTLLAILAHPARPGSPPPGSRWQPWPCSTPSWRNTHTTSRKPTATTAGCPVPEVCRIPRSGPAAPEPRTHGQLRPAGRTQPQPLPP